MDIGEGELNRLGVIRALPNACGANMLCRAVSSRSVVGDERVPLEPKKSPSPSPLPSDNGDDHF